MERPRTNTHALSGIRTRDPVYKSSRPARPLDWHVSNIHNTSSPKQMQRHITYKLSGFQEYFMKFEVSRSGKNVGCGLLGCAFLQVVISISEESSNHLQDHTASHRRTQFIPIFMSWRCRIGREETPFTRNGSPHVTCQVYYITISSVRV
jgi:hypothetical protein